MSSSVGDGSPTLLTLLLLLLPMREDREESTVFAPTLPADNNSMLVMVIKGMNIKKKYMMMVKI